MFGRQKIVTRFAPSPTGPFHVGSLRTALFNFLYTRKNKGTYLLRIEDTDKERSKKEYEDDILEMLKWLGLAHDDFYRQGEHVGSHKELLKKLVDEGKAYVSNEKEIDRETVSEKADLNNRRDSVIRFKNPNKVVSFDDLILGNISVDTTDLGDFVIAKDFETPLYNFAVVCDDVAMGITHVIRGQDHISNTPRQILIYEALGQKTPHFAHIPLILAPDKTKLSKRKHGESLSVRTYRDSGYLPEALINFMALIGWNPGDEREVFTLKELIKEFSMERVQKSSGVFNIEKLNWLNKEHLKLLNSEKQIEYVKKYLSSEWLKKCGDEKTTRVLPSIFDRIVNGIEIRDLEKNGELEYIISRPNLDLSVLKDKEKEDITPTIKHLEKIVSILEAISESNFTMDNIKEKTIAYANTLSKRGAVLHPMRYALTGMQKSPDPFTVSYVLGKQDSIERLKIAVGLLAG